MHDAAYYIDLLLSGVTVGSLYALIAIGYTMVYGILRLINFAHGDIFMMAGFFMVYMSASMPLIMSAASSVSTSICKETIKPEPSEAVRISQE